MNSDVRPTNSTSEANSKGRHTTTTRDLLQLPNGALLIDTPGMREFGLTFEDHQGEELFPAIQQHAVNCKYSDCSHTNEMGCAVLEAIQSGELEVDAYESYLKLRKEQARFEIRVEDKKRINKQFGKLTKEAKNHRKKYKY
jgi:ribosome biogenesis GTPase